MSPVCWSSAMYWLAIFHKKILKRLLLAHLYIILCIYPLVEEVSRVLLSGILTLPYGIAPTV